MYEKYTPKHVFWKQLKKIFCIKMSPLSLISPKMLALVNDSFLSFKKHKSRALRAQRESFYFIILGRIVFNLEMLSIFKVLPIMNTYRLKNQICLNSLLLNLLIWIEKSHFLQYLSDRQPACVLLSDNLGTRGPLLLQCQKRQTSRIHFQ